MLNYKIFNIYGSRMFFWQRCNIKRRDFDFNRFMSESATECLLLYSKNSLYSVLIIFESNVIYTIGDLSNASENIAR